MLIFERTNPNVYYLYKSKLCFSSQFDTLVYREQYLVLYPFTYLLQQSHRFLTLYALLDFKSIAICVKKVPNWLPIILILLSNDIHMNPGPHFDNNSFSFMSWNVISLVKDNCVRLIEAHNSTFNYDLISICETSLNDSVELTETLLND